jgi:hypothetical protein
MGVQGCGLRADPALAKRRRWTRPRRPTRAQTSRSAACALGAVDKATVVLTDRQIEFLDRLVADIRATNGAAVSRANVIRALIDALAESDLDLTASHSEKDLTRVFTERLRHRPVTEHAGPRERNR